MGIEPRNSQIVVKYAIIKLHSQLIPIQILVNKLKLFVKTLLLYSGHLTTAFCFCVSFLDSDVT